MKDLGFCFDGDGNTFFIVSLISSASIWDGNVCPQFRITFNFAVKQGVVESALCLVLFQGSLAQKTTA